MMLSNEKEAVNALQVACYYNNKVYDDYATILWYWTNGDYEPVHAWIVKYESDWFAYIKGWHDYAGWDSQSDLEIHFAESLEKAKRFVPEYIRNTDSGVCYVRGS